MEGTTIEDYMDLGLLAASDVVREITGSPTLNVMGYCIGGTLLAMALAWLAARGDKRLELATFMVSLQDFSRVGDTAVFLGEAPSTSSSSRCWSAAISTAARCRTCSTCCAATT